MEHFPSANKKLPAPRRELTDYAILRGSKEFKMSLKKRGSSFQRTRTNNRSVVKKYNFLRSFIFNESSLNVAPVGF